jgi:hypothetical protein
VNATGRWLLGIAGPDWTALIALLAFFLSVSAIVPQLWGWWNRKRKKVRLELDLLDGTTTATVSSPGQFSLPLRIRNQSAFHVAIHRVIVTSVDLSIRFQGANVDGSRASIDKLDKGSQGFSTKISVPAPLSNFETLVAQPWGEFDSSGTHQIDVEVLTTPTNRMGPVSVWIEAERLHAAFPVR